MPSPIWPVFRFLLLAVASYCCFLLLASCCCFLLLTSCFFLLLLAAACCEWRLIFKSSGSQDVTARSKGKTAAIALGSNKVSLGICSHWVMRWGRAGKFSTPNRQIRHDFQLICRYYVANIHVSPPNDHDISMLATFFSSKCRRYYQLSCS